MKIMFRDEAIEVKKRKSYPSRFKCGDLLIGPTGILLKVVTVQPNCPHIENLAAHFVAVLVETEAGQKIPLNGVIHGECDVYRRVRK